MTPEQFLVFVRNYIAVNPEIAAKVSDFVQAGLNETLQKARERAADMEVALVCALSPKIKNSQQLIKDKLGKWEGQTSCQWNWLTDNASGSDNG